MSLRKGHHSSPEDSEDDAYESDEEVEAREAYESDKADWMSDHADEIENEKIDRDNDRY